MDARAPEPQAAVAAEQERALGILVKIVGMRLGAAWKSLQLVRRAEQWGWGLGGRRDTGKQERAPGILVKTVGMRLGAA